MNSLTSRQRWHNSKTLRSNIWKTDSAGVFMYLHEGVILCAPPWLIILFNALTPTEYIYVYIRRWNFNRVTLLLTYCLSSIQTVSCYTKMGSTFQTITSLNFNWIKTGWSICEANLVVESDIIVEQPYSPVTINTASNSMKIYWLY